MKLVLHFVSRRVTYDFGSKVFEFYDFILVRPFMAPSVIHQCGEKHQLFPVYRRGKETQTARSLATIMRKPRLTPLPLLDYAMT
jgi:hypothetical protein